MQYIGEHLWVGHLGHFFIVLGFCSAILSMASYYFAEKHKGKEDQLGRSEAAVWKKMGRWAFLTHGVSVFSIIGLVFYIMTERMYEYAYAYNHVSDDLPMSYILSAFWEGQEGSFLLWMFWHVVLGMILLARSREWENGVMMFVSLVQAVLASFLLGIYFGGTKIGINPFVLLRDTMDIPLFNQADYLSKITGTGLNPLLQNYWMTIHPPTLFLGFASVTVPFCFAATGLWTQRHTQWLRPVMPWALFSAAILGAGILMGGAWAYEALSFGGYWAWDPVENMSLVPWIILVAGLHTNAVAKATGHSIAATALFYMLGFVLVIYSTFLTRSGVLGDSSVHAFTELGLESHLVLGLLLFCGVSCFLYLKNRRGIPQKEKEESISSKEFWMFIGSLVLLISAALISVTTSIPVYNKILDGVGLLNGSDMSHLHRALPNDPVAHYNKYQMWVAVLIGLFSGITQFLRYRESNFSKWKGRFLTGTGISAAVALLLTVASAQFISIQAWQYHALAFGCWFGVVSNVAYLFTTARTNPKLLGSALSHIGFGVMIIGSMASGLDKHHISTNPFAQKGIIDGFSEEDYNRNILLIKNKPMMMKGYEVTYLRDSMAGYDRYFTVNYKKKDLQGNVTEEFDLNPYIIYEKTFQKVAASNPSTKHYLGKDIFTHVASLPRAETDPEYARSLEDSLDYKSFVVSIQDTFNTKELRGKVLRIIGNPQHSDYVRKPNDAALGVEIEITEKETGRTEVVTPIAVVRGAKIIRFPVHLPDVESKLKLTPGFFEEIYIPENGLDYHAYTIKNGESFNHEGARVVFNGFGQDPTHRDYHPEEGDKAFNAILNVEKDGKRYVAKPIYFIRDNRVFNVKEEFPELGMHFKIADVDPLAENVTILAAQSEPRREQFTLQVAGDVPSSEYIVLEAIVFPGINLFWLGSVLMLLGLTVAMWLRWSQRH